MTTLSDYARLYGSMLPDIPDAGLGPATNATRAGHQNAFLSAGQNQHRPADYLQPVAEALSIPLGSYGAGQMIGEGYQTAREANSLMDFGQGAGEHAEHGDQQPVGRARHRRECLLQIL